jgi:hypothetical protein
MSLRVMILYKFMGLIYTLSYCMIIFVAILLLNSHNLLIILILIHTIYRYITSFNSYYLNYAITLWVIKYARIHLIHTNGEQGSARRK